MKPFPSLSRRDLVMPLLALAFASMACCALVGARMIWAHSVHYGFLVWNLFLAWMPLVFALLAREAYRDEVRPGWRFYAASAAWLLFYPNAPYIFTDVIHPVISGRGDFWLDLLMVQLAALTGLVLGFVSLYLMQAIVTRMLGWWQGWFLIAAVAGLSGIGIYLGRFVRLNSWDAVLQPTKLYDGLTALMANSLANPAYLAFPVLFGAFLFVSYVMLYALTQLPVSAPFAQGPTPKTGP